MVLPPNTNIEVQRPFLGGPFWEALFGRLQGIKREGDGGCLCTSVIVSGRLFPTEHYLGCSSAISQGEGKGEVSMCWVRRCTRIVDRHSRRALFVFPLGLFLARILLGQARPASLACPLCSLGGAKLNCSLWLVKFPHTCLPLGVSVLANQLLSACHLGSELENSSVGVTLVSSGQKGPSFAKLSKCFQLPTRPWDNTHIVPPVNIPIPTKLGSIMGGAPIPKWDPIGCEPWPHDVKPEGKHTGLLAMETGSIGC